MSPFEIEFFPSLRHAAIQACTTRSQTSAGRARKACTETLVAVASNEYRGRYGAPSYQRRGNTMPHAALYTEQCETIEWLLIYKFGA